MQDRENRLPLNEYRKSRLDQAVLGVQEFVPLGLRLVRLKQSDFGSIDELCRALRQHPRARFVVICQAVTDLENLSESFFGSLSGGQLAIDAQFVFNHRLHAESGMNI